MSPPGFSHLYSFFYACCKNDPYSYKNLLRNLTDDEGILPPMYKTKDSDEPRYRTFSSIVEVGGVVYQGAAAKSKKLAELNAAKAAYSSFMERKLGVFPLIVSLTEIETEFLKICLVNHHFSTDAGKLFEPRYFLEFSPCLGSVTVISVKAGSSSSSSSTYNKPIHC